jgi:YoeB-like toxin of bacterial type II toxin-antitoxin system
MSDPTDGIGKPEPHKHLLTGAWFRRITLVTARRVASPGEFARDRPHHFARIGGMSTLASDSGFGQHPLRVARVLRVEEQACEVWTPDAVTSAAFAPMFPTPRTERVSPGHLVALASGPGAKEVVVWRWFDAVVLGVADDDNVRLWEPAHGEVVARRRPSYEELEPGSRAYASAGLPGADWWVAGPASHLPQAANVELDEVDALYSANQLWAKVFTPTD